MHLRQRSLIDYNAAVGCERAPKLIDLAVEQLLDKARSWRPYAGAIIRHAVTKPELATYTEADWRDQRTLLKHASFLPHVNASMRKNWEAHPSCPSSTISDMYFERTVDHRHTAVHMDQDIRDDFPTHGPLAGLLVVSGMMNYYVSACRRDPFDPKNHDFFEAQKKRPDFDELTLVTARAGDLLLFTPETWHEGLVEGNDVIRAIFRTRIQSNQPVE